MSNWGSSDRERGVGGCCGGGEGGAKAEAENGSSFVCWNEGDV